jgi:hypothetical protein
MQDAVAALHASFAYALALFHLSDSTSSSIMIHCERGSLAKALFARLPLSIRLFAPLDYSGARDLKILGGLGGGGEAVVCRRA